MNPLILISAAGWGVFLLLQARDRRNQPSAPTADAPAGAAPFQAGGATSPPAQNRPPAAAAPVVDGIPPVVDDKGAIQGGTPGLVNNWYARLQARGFATDPSSGVIVRQTPRGPVYLTARDAQRAEAATAGASPQETASERRKRQVAQARRLAQSRARGGSGPRPGIR